MFRTLNLIAVILFCAAAALAQTATPTPSAPSRSHVERFSTPKERAEQAEAIANQRLAANPSDAAALNLRGVARLRFGRYKESYEDLSRAAALKPDNAEYQTNLGYVLWKLGRANEAVAATRTALKLNDKNFTARFQMGRFLLRMGGQANQREAVTHLQKAIELQPRAYDVRFELISAYRALGSKAEASSQLDLLWDSLPSDPRVFYTSALLATDRDDMVGAVKDFQEALRRDPSMIDAWRDLGLVFVKLQHWPEAVYAFAELARRQSDSVEAAYFHALALFNNSQVAEAEKEVRRALRINAGAAEADTLLGVILASRGNANAEASEALTQAIALNPNSFDANFYLGRVQYALRDYAGAAKSLRAAVSLNPRHAQARFFLGTVLEAAGDSQSALAEYQELVKLEPDSAMGQLGLGALLVKQGKIEEAINKLKRAISLDPKSFEAYWALGRALSLAEHYAEAVEALTTATTLSPNRADAHYQLGLALRRLGRADEAAREFATVDKLNAEFRTNTPP